MNDLNQTTQLPATLNARIAALKAKQGLAIETWQPEPGESLIGELIGSQKAVGTYGENVQILIRDERGNITSADSHNG